jgi:DNA-binding transcriptional ArsR family regulator
MAAALVRESTARRFRALSHPARLRIIELLARGSKSVSDLAQLTRLPADTVSKHLRVLASVNVVGRSQQGNFARYALRDPELQRLVALGYRGVMREVQRLQSVAELGRKHDIGD